MIGTKQLLKARMLTKIGAFARTFRKEEDGVSKVLQTARFLLLPILTRHWNLMKLLPTTLQRRALAG